MGHVQVDQADLDGFVSEARATIPIARAAEGNLPFSCAVDEPAAGPVRNAAATKRLSTPTGRPHVRDLFARWGARMRNEVRKFDAANERVPMDA